MMIMFKPQELFKSGGGFSADARYGPDIALAPGGPDRTDPAASAFADGYAKGAADAQIRAQQDEVACSRIHHAFERLADTDILQLEERLRQTVIALCEAAMAPLSIDPDGLSARIRKALDMLRRAEDERVLRLHPEDLALVEGRLPDDLKVDPDPALPRGELRIETPGGGVEDGPQQWRLALLEAFHQC